MKLPEVQGRKSSHMAPRDEVEKLRLFNSETSLSVSSTTVTFVRILWFIKWFAKSTFRLQQLSEKRETWRRALCIRLSRFALD